MARQKARGKSEEGLGDFTFLYTVWFYCVHLLKLLYDAVNILTETGWSLKSLQLGNLKIGSTFFFVIQRADIISKADQQ